MYDMFEHMNVSDGGGGKRPAMGKRGGKPSRKKATVSSQFKVRSSQLQAEGGNSINMNNLSTVVLFSCISQCVLFSQTVYFCCLGFPALLSDDSEPGQSLLCAVPKAQQ